MVRPSPRPSLFPYTTLFRSRLLHRHQCRESCKSLLPRLQCCHSVNELCVDLRPDRKMRSRSRSEEHTSELQSLRHLVCRLLPEKKNDDSHNPEHTYGDADIA